MAFQQRRKAKEHTKRSRLGRLFKVNEGVQYDENTKEYDLNKSSAAATGIKQFQNLKEGSTFSSQAEPYRQMSDEELIGTLEEMKKSDKPSNSWDEGFQTAVTERLAEPRFQPPLPMMPKEQVMAGLSIAPNASYEYNMVSKRFTDEDLGLKQYKPEFLDGETEESASWQYRQKLGNEAQRRQAIYNTLHSATPESRIPQLEKSAYAFYPDEAHDLDSGGGPDVAAAAPPAAPPGGPNGPNGPNNPFNFPNRDDLKQKSADFYKEKIQMEDNTSHFESAKQEPEINDNLKPSENWVYPDKFGTNGKTAEDYFAENIKKDSSENN